MKLILSFIVGSIWVTLATVIAEKHGTKMGGILAGLPSTIVISLFFIAWTQTPAFASEATNIIPIGAGINALVIVVYILLSRYNLFISIAGGLALWFSLNFTLISMNFNNMLYSLIGFVIIWTISFYIIEKKANILSVGSKKMRYTMSQLMFRGLLGGAVISFAVFMAKIGGPLYGGVFSNFPAVITSTMIITYLAHGEKFSSAVLKVLMFGSISVTVYAVAVKYLYVILGLVFGTVVSFLIALLSGYLYYLVVKKKVI